MLKSNQIYFQKTSECKRSDICVYISNLKYRRSRYLKFLGVPEAAHEMAIKAPDFHEYRMSFFFSSP